MRKGFTLVELLITMAIVGTISAAIVLILDPAELLKQARDATRIQDIETLNSALILYLTDVVPTDLNAARANTECAIGAGAKYYAHVAPTTNSFVNRTDLDPKIITVSQAANGTGWLPVDFSQIFGGGAASPLKVLPLDPTNSGDLVYRYACNMTSGASSYELNAAFESNKYKVQLDRDGKDGGDKNTDPNSFYEKGNDLTL